jgi:hypothetical protein
VGATVQAGHALDARLRLGRAPETQLRIDAIGEAGVTPYGRLDGARAPESQLGGRLLVALSAVSAR